MKIMRDKLGKFIKGHKHSKKIREKIRETQKKHKYHRKHSEETKEKMRRAHKSYRGSKNWNWKGGKKLDGRGYILIYQPEHPHCNTNRYVREHRLVIEKQIGRYLHRWEVSHHINKIKTNNRPENLMAFNTESAHQRFEKGGKVEPSEIVYVGSKEKKP